MFKTYLDEIKNMLNSRDRYKFDTARKNIYLIYVKYMTT